MTPTILAPARRNAAAPFFVLAFALSWAVWVPAAAASRGMLALEMSPTLTGVLGVFGPALAALIMAAISGGTAGLRGLLGRFLIWRVGALWYAFALLWPAVHSLATTGVQVLLGSTAPDFVNPPVLQLYPAPPEAFAAGPWPLLPMVFLQQMLLGSAMGEEPGWRGYALPRLQAKRSPLQASLIIGTLWGLWHLPLWLTAGHPLAGSFFGWLLLGTIGEAIVYTWLFNNTRGSLLPVLILHGSTATTGLFLSAAEGSPLVGLGLTWLLAAAVIALGGLGQRGDEGVAVGAKGG